jgi:hypothetical protein
MRKAKSEDAFVIRRPAPSGRRFKRPEPEMLLTTIEMDE